MKTSIIIPVFNEVKTVEEIIKKVEILDIDKEIIAIDDGSNDGSEIVLKKLYNEGRIKLIIHEKNLGKGASIKSGLTAAEGDIIVIQDADLETNPQDILQLIRPIEKNETRVVFGFRNSGNFRSIYWWGGKAVSLITKLLYGGNIKDVNNGYKVMTRELWQSLDLKSNHFQICEEITAKLLKQKEKIIQIQTQYSPRTKKQGKKLGFVDGVISIWTLLKYRFKIFFRWWFAAFTVYLIVILLIGWNYGFSFFMPVNDDSVAFMQTAKNLVHYGVFSIDGVAQTAEPTLPLHPTNFVTPGYVFWLALIYLIFKSFTPAIFIGALVFALSAPLTYLLAKEITANEKIAFWSALLFLFEPLSLYYAGLLFSEQLFIPIFLLACLAFVKYFNRHNKKALFVSLLLFSFATLVRPILFYFLPFLILFVAIKEIKTSKKQLALFILTAILAAYSLVGIWIIRNKIVLNTWQVSSNQGHTLGYHYDILRQYLVKNRGFDPGPLDVPGPSLYGNQEYDTLLGEEASKMLLKYKWDYLKIHLGYMPLFFLSSGYDGLSSRILNKPLLLGGTFRNDLVLSLSKGRIVESLKILANAPAAVYIFLIGILIWGLIAILALVGLVFSWREKSSGTKLVLVFIVTLLIYFALITSPLITARYRLPINPFIFALAVSGVTYAIKKIKNA